MIDKISKWLMVATVFGILANGCVQSKINKVQIDINRYHSERLELLEKRTRFLLEREGKASRSINAAAS